MAFGTYLALGDSISIDQYPVLDYSDRRGGLRVPRPGLGAASLFARNDDEVWPEFARRDLATLHPGITWRVLASDGATTDTVREWQTGALGTVNPQAETLITLTAGGNDLLGLIGASARDGAAGVRETLANLDTVVTELLARLPRATVLVGNVYDPTDGTGDLEGTRVRPQEMRWLADYNEGVARLCRTRGVRLVDIHGHFAGHGRAAPAAQRWYWTASLIEPGFRGASEVRRLWLAALEDERR
jgi:lysophospholipase L1-like esterase